jgi:hypothetical protein
LGGVCLEPAAVQLGGRLVAVFPDGPGAVGPLLVLGGLGFELLALDVQKVGEVPGVRCFGFVAAGLGVGCLLPGVGFGVGGGP